MPSLADLGVMDHMSRSDDDMDDNSSTCSYYSLSEVEDMSFGKIPAHQVRKQSEQVPEFSHFSTYPHTFRNSEALPLKVPGPWLEYPLCLNGSYKHSTEGPGPARVIINPSVPGGHDVIYHPTKWEGRFLQAKYRPKGYRARISGCTAMPTIPSPPSSPLLSPSLPLSPSFFSPPVSPGFYGASHGLIQMTPQQAFALAAQQQYVAWQQQSLMASCMYPQVMGYNGVVRGQSLLEF
ncbi:extracellular guanyl-specific ribonuclease Fl2 [Fusarium tjaetaba]|uniref:Extracellular guanyl-specific ribonuclease Fl2 n=1 Tax=Fusarium tjaetaba TaxID=1567544 RepID=A0A8H5QWX9_9HYPO|nr:extracellular guanyl-specific ribonuclease Fl2 [Fusarium tjaetaba]KAF5622103.1 extracellular guanyl-specific ribonuclease Fl2 [Fusarium tjaetaba]